MRVVGLTGGIGSGKSEVARAWRSLGIPVIDADAVSRGQMRPGGPVLAAVAAEFGPGVLGPDGSLDRAALAAQVFADPARRRRLEELTHGPVMAETARRLDVLAQAGCRLAVLEAALLIETGVHATLDGLVAVLAPEDQRVRRVMARDGGDEAAVRARMAAQVNDVARRAAASHVLDNDGGLDALRARAMSLAVDLVLGQQG